MQRLIYLGQLAGKLLRSSLLSRFDRIHFLAVFLFVLNGVIVLRLFNLQVLNGSFYSALAADQHELGEKLLPKRGEIFVKEDGKKYAVVTNKNYPALYAIPKEITQPGWTAKQLAEILKIDQIELEKRLNKPNDPYEPIKSKISDEEAKQIKELKLPGLAFYEEPGRFYLDKNLFSHIVGFVGLVGDRKKGQYGLEGHWDEALSGQAGYLVSEKDLTGRWIASASRYLQEAEDGSSLVLTIDRTIQYYVCSKLEEIVGKYKAEGGTVIIVEPETGGIVAMCSFPSFDPNHYNQVPSGSIYNNPATFVDFEPGSTFKVITMAAGLDSSLVSPQSTYFDEGFVKIGKYTIKNSDGKSHGQVDMTTVLEQSLNTGAIDVARKLGQSVFRKYVEDFGFGDLTGIELDSESKGNLNSLKKRGEVFLATASFGQGITVTPLQLVAAYAAIANGGKLMKPYLVDEVIKPSGQLTKTRPQVIRQIISNRAATLLSGMLVSVVKEGHSKKADVPGYLIGAKTGTAQVANKDGPGYSQDTIHSVVGFGPVDNPRFAMIIKLDKPKDVRFAETSVVPLFGEIAKFILNYWKVNPGESGSP